MLLISMYPSEHMPRAAELSLNEPCNAGGIRTAVLVMGAWLQTTNRISPGEFMAPNGTASMRVTTRMRVENIVTPTRIKPKRNGKPVATAMT